MRVIVNSLYTGALQSLPELMGHGADGGDVGFEAFADALSVFCVRGVFSATRGTVARPERRTSLAKDSASAGHLSG